MTDYVLRVQSAQERMVEPTSHLDPHPFDLLNGTITPDRPRTYRQMGRQPLRDIVLSGDLTILIHDRVQAAWKESHIDGWSTFAADVRLRDGTAVPGYAGLVVLGRCRLPEVEDPGEGQRVRGIQPTEWDGTDLVLGTGTGLVLVTERVRQVARDADLRGFRFEPVDDYLWWS